MFNKYIGKHEEKKKILEKNMFTHTQIKLQNLNARLVIIYCSLVTTAPPMIIKWAL